jgi:hypothetical protein
MWLTFSYFKLRYYQLFRAEFAESQNDVVASFVNTLNSQKMTSSTSSPKIIKLIVGIEDAFLRIREATLALPVAFVTGLLSPTCSRQRYLGKPIFFRSPTCSICYRVIVADLQSAKIFEETDFFRSLHFCRDDKKNLHFDRRIKNLLDSLKNRFYDLLRGG